MEKPKECPACGSENIWRNFYDNNGENEVIKSVVCKSCGYHWKETYRTELVKIDDESGKPIEECPQCGGKQFRLDAHWHRNAEKMCLNGHVGIIATCTNCGHKESRVLLVTEEAVQKWLGNLEKGI